MIYKEFCLTNFPFLLMNKMKIYIMTYLVVITLVGGGGANKALTFTIKVLAQNTKVLLKMLCNSETDRSSKTSQILYLSLFLFCISIQLTSCVSDTSYNATTIMLTNNTSNNSVGDDLYVIKAMVYEIGILTDADNATNDTTERQEVELSFYNSPIEDNGSS